MGTDAYLVPLGGLLFLSACHGSTSVSAATTMASSRVIEFHSWCLGTQNMETWLSLSRSTIESAPQVLPRRVVSFDDVLHPLLQPLSGRRADRDKGHHTKIDRAAAVCSLDGACTREEKGRYFSCRKPKKTAMSKEEMSLVVATILRTASPALSGKFPFSV